MQISEFVLAWRLATRKMRRTALTLAPKIQKYGNRPYGEDQPRAQAFVSGQDMQDAVSRQI